MTGQDHMSHHNGGALPLGTDERDEPKARKACMNCRKQKMKCVAGRSNTCRRCHRAGLPCVYVPRANAAALPVAAASPADQHFKQDVLRRVKAIEERLGILSPSRDPQQEATGSLHGSDDGGDQNVLDGQRSLDPLWQAIKALEKSSPKSVPGAVWRKKTVGELFASFHSRMPGLHFMPEKQTFSEPKPILLASMLYCCALRGPPSIASELAPHYYAVLCNAIAQLSIPGSEIGTPPGGSLEAAEEWAFQTVLGIVLAGLLNDPDVNEAGIWLSAAYRLAVEYCPEYDSESRREWRKLFSGVQIVDLERASLRLSCPVIPIEPPIALLQPSQRDQLYSLSRMMHAGLTHFTKRGLRTIWSCFSPDAVRASNDHTPVRKLTPVDAAVIRDWARQLDEWLVEFGNDSSESASDEGRRLVFRQYVLHRLVVLSIYHPARDCNLWSSGSTPLEQQEMLLSARATLKLHLHDDSIWSNWDVVLITWAAVIVLQGVAGGVGEVDDLRNIRIHLEMLHQMNQPERPVCNKLITRLEQDLDLVNTPEASSLVPEPLTIDNPDWQIFDHLSLDRIDYFA